MDSVGVELSATLPVLLGQAVARLPKQSSPVD
jgi:hypothetical protein